MLRSTKVYIVIASLFMGCADPDQAWIDYENDEPEDIGLTMKEIAKKLEAVSPKISNKPLKPVLTVPYVHPSTPATVDYDFDKAGWWTDGKYVSHKGTNTSIHPSEFTVFKDPPSDSDESTDSGFEDECRRHEIFKKRRDMKPPYATWDEVLDSEGLDHNGKKIRPKTKNDLRFDALFNRFMKKNPGGVTYEEILKNQFGPQPTHTSSPLPTAEDPYYIDINLVHYDSTGTLYRYVPANLSKYGPFFKKVRELEYFINYTFLTADAKGLDECFQASMQERFKNETVKSPYPSIKRSILTKDEFLSCLESVNKTLVKQNAVQSLFFSYKTPITDDLFLEISTTDILQSNR